MLTEQFTDDYMDRLLHRIRFILDKDQQPKRPPSLDLDPAYSLHVYRERLHSEEGAHCKGNRSPTPSPEFNNKLRRINSPHWELQAPLNTMTLPDVFELLSTEDAASIVCVRRIHRLGFKSVRIIRRFFSAMGDVRRIVVLPSRSKEWFCGASAQIRPSSMCFMVLGDRESASRILLRDKYRISSCEVHVCTYTPHSFCSDTTEGGLQTRPSSNSSIDTCQSP